jgi:hypothetical protein
LLSQCETGKLVDLEEGMFKNIFPATFAFIQYALPGYIESGTA